MKTILKMLVAIIVAVIVACVLAAVDASFNTVVCAYFGVGLMLCALFGVFDEKKRKEPEHDSIRHYDGRKNYGQAAVFMGTACLFIGTPQQCEDMCDDLWHWGQQAHMETIDGSESSFEIL